jgi:iron-regulated transporter 1
VKRLSSPSRKILWSRFLTHSGDQAWDFVLPLVLASLLPGRLELVALWYLLVRVVHLVFVGRLCALVDRRSRLFVVRLGIGLQTLGVASSLFLLGVAAFNPDLIDGRSVGELGFFVIFVALILSAVMASLGAALMDVAVSQDFVPAVVEPAELTLVNSRLKQIDLTTELCAPIVAGLLIAAGKKWASDIHVSAGLLVGPSIVALWNIFSFAPEYKLLRGVLSSLKEANPDGATREEVLSDLSVSEKLFGWPSAFFRSWVEFFREPAVLSMIAWALVWLTVISPHGVLLTTWLLQNWNLSEVLLGVFRGLGAVFGLLATLAFPKIAAKVGLVRAAAFFVVWQAMCLLVAGAAFSIGVSAHWWFIAAVLFSRIGLYGFSLGETEIRQRFVQRRGVVSGQVNALTTAATLLVFGAGSMFTDQENFKWLIWGSVGAVGLAALLQVIWSFFSSKRKEC